jgi:hypothetical protein
MKRKFFKFRSRLLKPASRSERIAILYLTDSEEAEPHCEFTVLEETVIQMGVQVKRE